MGLLDRLRGDDGPRVAFLGIDGVPFSLIEDNEAVFENLHAIADAGTATAIDSIVPPESSACWPALTCGVNPGKTGVYGFQDREVGSDEPYIPLGSHVRATRLWDRVTDAGRDASVFNVPVTFPPDERVQRMVSGFLSPNLADAARPDELASTLEGLGYRIDVDASHGHDEDKADFVADANDTLDARYRAFSHYVDRDDWDLFFGVFMTTDRVNHFLFGDYERDGPYRGDFLEFYATLDRYIGDLHDALPDDVPLVIASDHGFTTLEREVHLNAWLEREGWLEFDTDDPEELGDLAPSSRAFSLIPGRFFINLEGREPNGSVPRASFESVRDELRSMLEDLEGPDGRPVCDRVVDGEAAFDGPHTDIGPDLVAIPTDGFDLKAGFSGGDAVFTTGPRNGMHTFANATLIADEGDLRVDGVDLLDIAPTLLDLLEVDVDPTALDGESLVA